MITFGKLRSIITEKVIDRLPVPQSVKQRAEKLFDDVELSIDEFISKPEKKEKRDKKKKDKEKKKDKKKDKEKKKDKKKDKGAPSVHPPDEKFFPTIDEEHEFSPEKIDAVLIAASEDNVPRVLMRVQFHTVFRDGEEQDEWKTVGYNSSPEYKLRFWRGEMEYTTDKYKVLSMTPITFNIQYYERKKRQARRRKK